MRRSLRLSRHKRIVDPKNGVDTGGKIGSAGESLSGQPSRPTVYKIGFPYCNYSGGVKDPPSELSDLIRPDT